MSITRVAQLAGVSSSTVSRVINNHPRVAPETATSVRKAMLELGYTPSENRPGPKPASRRAGVTHVSFLVFGTHQRGRSTPGFEELLHGLSATAARNNVDLVFNHVPDIDALHQRLTSQKVDGLLLGGIADNATIRQKVGSLPAVWLMGNRRRPDFGDQVMPDSYAVGELAAKHLVSRGHKLCAFLNLDSGHWAIHLYGHAFRRTCEEMGASAVLLEQPKQLTNDSWREHAPEAVERMVQQYLALSPRPTGLFVAEDMQTALLQPALQRAGVPIGNGVELISCNHERPYLVGLSPTPLSIDIRVGAIGSRGLEQLLWRLDHPAAHDRVITMLEPHLSQG
jgi:LacI family transcriptional regulator